MALRRPRAERSVDIDPLYDQTRPLVIFGADFRDVGRNRRQPVGDDANRFLRVHYRNKLDHGRFARRDFKVVNQALMNLRRRTDQGMKGDGLVRLKTVAGNANAVLTSEVRGKLPERNLDIGRDPGAEDRHAIIDMTIDTARRFDASFILDVKPLFGRPGLRTAGNGRV